MIVYDSYLEKCIEMERKEEWIVCIYMEENEDKIKSTIVKAVGTCFSASKEPSVVNILQYFT